MDQNILKQDPEHSRGFLTMGILHHIGLTKEHKGFFGEATLDEAISLLENRDGQHFEHLILCLSRFKDHVLSLPNLAEIQDDFNINVSKSLSTSPEKRRKRLDKADSLPESIIVVTTVYKRNPDVVAEVLERAKGICEKCKQPAPFLRASDGTPYLEVHHKITPAAGGEDTVNNAIAVCPNCHRELHYGRQ